MKLIPISFFEGCTFFSFWCSLAPWQFSVLCVSKKYPETEMKFRCMEWVRILPSWAESGEIRLSVKLLWGQRRETQRRSAPESGPWRPTVHLNNEGRDCGAVTYFVHSTGCCVTESILRTELLLNRSILHDCLGLEIELLFFFFPPPAHLLHVSK